MRILLIPSAVLMPREMRNTFGKLPTALFPLGRKPMLYHLYEKYRNYVDRIFVVGCENSEKIATYIDASHLPVELICLDNLDSLGYTVKYGLKAIRSKYGMIDYTYINFADSLVNDELNSTGDFVYYANLDMNSQWTWFSESNGTITNILDKKDFYDKDENNNEFDGLFVGAFGITDTDYFISALENSYIGNTDLFYQALKRYNQKYQFKFIESLSWFDVGHNENYIKAQSSVAARSFNSIRIDEERGTLTKTSENKEKLINEIKWYLRLPKQLQYLLPRIYDYSLDFDSPYVTMEYYGYHTLHETLLYGDVSIAKWKNIFKKLLFAIKDMKSFSVNDRLESIRTAVMDMYVGKTIARLDKLRDNPIFANFFKNNIIINGVEYSALDSIISELPGMVDLLLVEDSDKFFSIIHGDLCFTNILVEDTYNFMRLIDARGSFGEFDIYGDNRYELAKLFHTLEGNYDYIIEDLFYISVNGNNITYRIDGCDKHIWNLFCEIFSKQIENINAIRLIESTLFLSMIPLHSDSSTRQYAMLATGVKLFNQVMEEISNGYGR